MQAPTVHTTIVRLSRLAVLGLVMVVVMLPARAEASRLKELVNIEGFRKNKLVGFGIVVGLAGTGDNAQSPLVRNSLANLLKRLSFSVSASEIKAKNVAAVLVTAELPPYGRSGMTIDVVVSSIGEARSLQGGTLIATPIRGPDNYTYAIAQGPLSLGGFSASGATGSTTVKNHTTVGRIPSGAIIERDAPTKLPRDRVVLLLKRPDFTTASRVSEAINRTFSAEISSVRDPSAVIVRIAPEQRKHAVHFIASLEAIQATPDAPAKVIIDERTGTVVVGEHVRLGRAAVAHGSLTIKISEGQEASQPGFLAEAGETIVTEKTDIEVVEEPGDLVVVTESATVSDIAAALNALGAKPRDLVSIFQALHAAGALQAEIEIL